MPPESFSIDLKDLLKDRKPSSSEPGEVVPTRWRGSPTTPSSRYNNRRSPSSCRWDGGRGLSDFRRPLTAHSKRVGGGWHITSVDSGPRASVVTGIRRDRIGDDSRETSASLNSKSYLQCDLVNSWGQLQSNDQHAMSNYDGVSPRCVQRLEKETSLGSSLDWKPLKWIRSGSLSSRGSGFSHSSSCKTVGVGTFDSKMETQQGNVICFQSPSGDDVTCATPKTPHDEANSRKKPRLGWGEGLAKYEKKKVDPVDIVDKDNGFRRGMTDVVSSSESLLPSPSSFPGKSPSLTGISESASPTTSCSFACSLYPGLEEKTSTITTTMDNDTCNPSVTSSQNHTQGLAFSLENLDLSEGFNLSLLLDELLQTDDTSAQGSGFAVDKLQAWKADVSKTLEITESEIDLLENELKSDGGSCTFLPASDFFLKQCNSKNTEVLKNSSSVEIPMGKAYAILEERVSPINIITISENAECSPDHVCGDGQVPTSSRCTVSVGGYICHHKEDKLYDSILGSNKVIANRASVELNKLLPSTHICTSVLRATDDSEIKKKLDMRKRFQKFKERVTILKFRTFQYSWKENLRLFSIRSGAKSQKKFESSSRMGYADHQKHRASNHPRLSSSAGNLSLVPSKEVLQYVNMLLSDSRVKTCRNAVKMPVFILDKKERMSTRFFTDNGLVENPIDVEKERSIVNSWTVEDKEMFLNKYALFGKNFRKIASFFQHKTVADCVEFYYKNHKSEFFQKRKNKSEFAKGKSFNTNNTYLVTSGKRHSRKVGTSLDMLGAASAMVDNVDDKILEQRSHDFAICCNEQETTAADVLAGICGSISSDALGSCITSSVDHQKVGGSLKRPLLNDVDEETCSDDSCGEEINSSTWTAEERSRFIKALRSYGKDFSMISRCMGTRSSDQCKMFFSKARKCLGLDVIDLGVGSEGTTGANQGGTGGSGSDQDDACMVDSGSGISHEKSSMECKMDAEESDSREEHAESDMNIVNDSRESELVLENSLTVDFEAEIKPREKGLNGNLEGDADSEAANMEESPQNTCSDSASGAKFDEDVTVVRVSSDREGTRTSEHELPSTVKGSSYCTAEDLSSVSYYSRAKYVENTTDAAINLDLNTASENSTCQGTAGDGIMMPNFFPQDSQRKAFICDDVSSKLTFRKSSQRSTIIDGYQWHLHKGSQSPNEPQGKLKLDESLLLPRDDYLQMGTDFTSNAHQQRRSSPLDIEKSNGSADLKLFGKIITKHPLPKANGGAPLECDKKLDAEKSSNLKFDESRNNDYAFGRENNVQLKTSYRFWDENRIQTGLSSLPGSEVLLHSNNLNVVPGFQARKLTNTNCGPSYHAHGQPVTVDKLSPELLPKGKGVVSLSTGVGGMSGVGGACNGVLDPMAAIRLHYVKTEQCENHVGESWRSNVSDIGSR